MNQPQILVAGIGNIFFGDDAFGVVVASRLASRPLPKNVRVIDFGIRGLDLAFELVRGYEVAVLVDAAPRGYGPPGTLYLIEPEIPGGCQALDNHAMDPIKVLRLASTLGTLPRVLLVGCEPTRDFNEMRDSMSAFVVRAVDPAAEMIVGLIDRLQSGSAVAGSSSHGTHHA